MSFKTVEVELEDGRVLPKGQDVLPSKAKALLTILETATNGSNRRQPNVGLSRFLSANDFPLTPDQFKAAMEADFFDQ